jgi:hypothetical protein
MRVAVRVQSLTASTQDGATATTGVEKTTNSQVTTQPQLSRTQIQFVFVGD